MKSMLFLAQQAINSSADLQNQVGWGIGQIMTFAALTAVIVLIGTVITDHSGAAWKHGLAKAFLTMMAGVFVCFLYNHFYGQQLQANFR